MNIEKKTYLRPEMDISSIGIRAGLCELSPLFIDGGVTHESFSKQELEEQNIWES